VFRGNTTASCPQEIRQAICSSALTQTCSGQQSGRPVCARLLTGQNRVLKSGLNMATRSSRAGYSAMKTPSFIRGGRHLVVITEVGAVGVVASFVRHVS